jgi:hypothetical protein
MHVEVRAGNAEVVQAVCKRETSQHPVHYHLKAAACITEAKRHTQKLEEAKRSGNGRFMSVL